MNLEKEYLRENKALQAIEALVMMLGDGVMVETATRGELEKFTIDIYELSHSAQRKICFDVHEDWRKQADIILAAAKKGGVLEYQNPSGLETEIKELEKHRDDWRGLCNIEQTVGMDWREKTKKAEAEIKRLKSILANKGIEI